MLITMEEKNHKEKTEEPKKNATNHEEFKTRKMFSFYL